ncbi:MAG: hypothetical protein PHH61_02980 [Candidatus Nanoarchaeia archaeon]|nr:hypothetical protein [Candidatus Nanoarchaeia archaeon]
MKKLLFLLIFAAALVSAANAQLVVTHELPAQATFDETYTGTVTVSATDESKFDISLLLPVTWEITDWSVTGNISAVKFEKTTVSYKDKVSESFHWLFDGPTTNNIVLTYQSKPLSTGAHNITLLWFYEGGFGSKDDVMYVSGEQQVGLTSCGNKICEGAYGESLFNCPMDCAFKYLQNVKVWLAVLAIALLIIFFGLGYKLYMAHKNENGLKWHYAQPVKPVTPVVPREEILPLPPPPQEWHRAKKAKKIRVVKMKHVAKKVGKSVKHKKPLKKAIKRAGKRSDFFSKTMKRLEIIKKSLK